MAIASGRTALQNPMAIAGTFDDFRWNKRLPYFAHGNSDSDNHVMLYIHERGEYSLLRATYAHLHLQHGVPSP